MSPLILTVVLGCAGGRPDAAPNGEHDGTANLDPEEANNAYQELACSGGFPQFDVCECDVAVDWSSMTEDVVGNTIDPTKLARLAFANFGKFSVEELLSNICGGTPLENNDSERYVDAFISSRTSLSLSEMSFFGTPFDSNDIEVGETWVLLWSDSFELVGNTRMMAMVSISDEGEHSVIMP